MSSFECVKCCKMVFQRLSVTASSSFDMLVLEEQEISVILVEIVVANLVVKLALKLAVRNSEFLHVSVLIAPSLMMALRICERLL